VAAAVSPRIVPWREGLEVAEELERGGIVRLDDFAPLPDGDLAYLREVLPELRSGRNISYHPRGDFLSGLGGGGALKRRARDVLAAYQAAVSQRLAALAPPYAGRWRAGKTNYRPEQERGRELSVRGSNERIHVDAFASGPTGGDRVLRFFTNVHPSEPRVWKSAGLLPDLLAEHGGALFEGGVALEPGLLDRVGSGTLNGLTELGVGPAQLIGSSPYDRAMRRLHNHLKEDEGFQAAVGRQVQLSFAPGESWMVFTDLVSHGVVSGQHALVATFYVDRAACVLPELSPWSLLEAL